LSQEFEASGVVQVAANSATAAERDALDTEEADRSKNVAQATYKASQASMRSQEAAEAAAAAEKLALEAAEHSKRAGTALAFDHALAAAQAFNQVCSHNLTSYCSSHLRCAQSFMCCR
jgi:hypothetical protein